MSDKGNFFLLPWRSYSSLTTEGIWREGGSSCCGHTEYPGAFLALFSQSWEPLTLLADQCFVCCCISIDLPLRRRFVFKTKNCLYENIWRELLLKLLKESKTLSGQWFGLGGTFKTISFHSLPRQGHLPLIQIIPAWPWTLQEWGSHSFSACPAHWEWASWLSSSEKQPFL